MKAELLGVQQIEFTQPQDNKVVSGIKLFVAYPDPDVEGKFCTSIYLDAEKQKKVLGIDPFSFIGKPVDVIYGNKGKILALAGWGDD